MNTKLNKILISQESSILEALKLLNKELEKCLIVIDGKKRLLGTLTDGDIRRSILNGIQPNKSIKGVYFKKPKKLIKGKYKKTDVKKILSDQKLRLVPIINKKGQVVDYITFDMVYRGLKKESKLKDVPVVIMAGGKGTRLEPFTKILPKALLPIKDKPIVQHIIDKFKASGIKIFFVTLNYKTDILKSFFEGLKPNYSINFAREKKPLGTAGGLKLIKNKIRQPFFVTNCDIIVNTDYEDIYNFHAETKSDITLIVSTKEYVIPYGVCDINKKNGFLTKINEKPSYNLLINTGLYVLSPSVLNLISKNKHMDFNELIKIAKRKKMRVSAYPVDENSWIDVGQWTEYHKSKEKFI